MFLQYTPAKMRKCNNKSRVPLRSWQPLHENHQDVYVLYTFLYVPSALLPTFAPWRCRNEHRGPSCHPRPGFPLRSVTFRPTFLYVLEQEAVYGSGVVLIKWTQRRWCSLAFLHVPANPSTHMRHLDMLSIRSVTFLDGPPTKHKRHTCFLCAPSRSCTCTHTQHFQHL